jgi:hypothetical protein
MKGKRKRDGLPLTRLNTYSMLLPGLDGRAGRDEEAVDQVGPVLDLLQLAFDDVDQAVQIGGGEVGHGPLEQRPDALEVVVSCHSSRRAPVSGVA